MYGKCFFFPSLVYFSLVGSFPSAPLFHTARAPAGVHPFHRIISFDWSL